MKFKAELLYKPSNFQMDDCLIEKVVELSAEEFSALVITPMDDHPVVIRNRGCMFSENGVMHCLLALGQDSNDGMLIESEGYSYPRYAAYIPGMRDIVNAEMDRAAEFIVRQGTEHTESGDWCIYFEELEKHLGLIIGEGDGLDSMLRVALKRRPEVAAVDMHDGCIEMTYRPEFCQGLSKEEPTQPSEACGAFVDAGLTRGPTMG